jgi:hypothetical protein
MASAMTSANIINLLRILPSGSTGIQPAGGCPLRNSDATSVQNVDLLKTPKVSYLVLSALLNYPKNPT